MYVGYCQQYTRANDFLVKGHKYDYFCGGLKTSVYKYSLYSYK